MRYLTRSDGQFLVGLRVDRQFKLRCILHYSHLHLELYLDPISQFVLFLPQIMPESGPQSTDCYIFFQRNLSKSVINVDVMRERYYIFHNGVKGRPNTKSRSILDKSRTQL
jgi:hypothetical protein